MAAEQGKENTMIFQVGNDLSGQFQKVMLEETYGVEAICDDAGIRKVAGTRAR